MKASNNSGQTLVEYLIVCTTMFLCTYVVIEVIRFLSFKTVLQTAVSFRTNEIAEVQFDLIQKGIIKEHLSFQDTDHKNFLKYYSTLIEQDINNLKTSLMSYDQKSDKHSLLFIKNHSIKISLHFINKGTPQNPAGVYLKAQTCLPVLFSYFYRNQETLSIGKKVANDEENRNCLGQFTSSSLAPLFWFSVRASAFAPWPASTEIYRKGLPLPHTMSMLSGDEMTFLREKYIDFPFSSLIQNKEKSHEK
jgi:hypothetical protein